MERVYTQSEVNRLIKAFEEYHEKKHGTSPCDFEIPLMEGLNMKELAKEIVRELTNSDIIRPHQS